MVFDDDVVLVVEDSDDDVKLITRALREVGFAARIHVAKNGAAAIAYLAGAGKFADRKGHPLPVLLILDLRLPGITGYDVLAWLKDKAEFRDIPVVIFSSLSPEENVRQTYARGATFYFAKPTHAGKYTAIFTEIKNYIAAHYSAKGRRRPRGGRNEK